MQTKNTNEVKVTYTKDNFSDYESNYNDRNNLKEAKKDISKILKDELVPNAIKIISELEIKESATNEYFTQLSKKEQKGYLAKYKINTKDKLALTICRLYSYGLTVDNDFSESKLNNILAFFKRGMLSKSMINKSNKLDETLKGLIKVWSNISKEDKKKFLKGDLNTNEIALNKEMFESLK